MKRFIETTTKTSLVLSSLVPLEILMVIKLWPLPSVLPWLFGAGILLGILGTFWVVNRARNESPFEPRIRSVEDAGSEVTGYLASFVLPLIAVQDASAQEWAAYLVFIFIYALVLANSQLLAVNPMLYLLGYRIWKIEFVEADREPGFAIGRQRPSVYSESSETPFLMTGDGRIFFEYKPQKGKN